jgi:N-acetylglucosaminyldiphosphoundecaprenol N-acetyl-beta-D-mannosaminyltransferase
MDVTEVLLSEGQSHRCKTEMIAGVKINCCSIDYALKAMDDNIRGERRRQYISITNTEAAYWARRIPSHMEYVNNARFSFCDGIGVVVSACAAGKKIWRLNGPILMLHCCEFGAAARWRHFFCGGREGVADLLSRKLTERYPGLVTAGTLCPPFRKLTAEEDQEIVDRINAAEPDILWVGLGLPKQERWIADHIERLNVPWLIGVGAAFDYHAGTVKWAPSYVRRMGLEWLYRSCFEPRLFPRGIRTVVGMIESSCIGVRERFGRCPR